MIKYFISISVLPLIGNVSFAKTYRAGNIKEFNQIKSQLLPGDTLILANGTWDNAALSISNKGTNQLPIVFISETPGKVIFTGNSKINIGGEYVEVNGFVFKQGYVLDGGVIEFRESVNKLANHCRVTNCVIDNYNKPDRLTEDNWVKLYGRHNRFDHNYIVDKKNLGTTLVVILNDKRNQENKNRIDHNYFGERPRLGRHQCV